MNTQILSSEECDQNLYGIKDNQCCSYPIKEDFRIKEITYNEYTFELILKQNPDVIKKVTIKSGITLEDLSHLNPVLYITDKLPIRINSDANIVLKSDDKYYYYSWSKKFNKWYYFELKEGSEFYDLSTQTKYILTNGELVNQTDVDLNISYTENTIEISNSSGDGITINSATHSKAGLLSKDDKIKLDGIASYTISSKIESSLTSKDIYLKTITYNSNTQESKEEIFTIPVVTESRNGLVTPEMLKTLESLFECVIEIKPEFQSNDNGLTYFYITRNPYDSQNTSHSITIPLVTENTQGLMSKIDKRIINKFKFNYVNQKISEVYYDGVLLTNEKFKITRDQYNYYIKGNDGTDLTIESYDPKTGKAGLFNKDIYNNLGTYTNTTPIVEDWRGFKKKEIFENVPYNKVLDKILYPDIPPIIKLLYSDPDGGVFEKESKVKLTLIEVLITKKSYDIDRIEVLDDYYNVVYTFKDLIIKDGGIFNINVPYDIDTTNQSEMFFRVRVIDTNNSIDEAVSKIFRFVYPYYYGISDNVNIDFNNLNKLIDIQSDKTLDFTANYQKIVFGYPAYYGELKNIFDQNGLNIIGFFTKVNKDLITENTTVPYIFYISNNTTTDNFAITFKY